MYINHINKSHFIFNSYILKQIIIMNEKNGYILIQYASDHISMESRTPMLPSGMPYPEQPLINFAGYKKWGAFLEPNKEIIDFIKANPLMDEEIKEFIEYNDKYINDFNFVVELLNLSSDSHFCDFPYNAFPNYYFFVPYSNFCYMFFPCSSCYLLSHRLRVLFHNDFYLSRFEDDAYLINSSIGNECYPNLLPSILHLKKYHDKACSSNKVNFANFKSDNLSMFMPCIWEMARSKANDFFNSLTSRLNELENLKQNEEKIECFWQKSVALYKASQILFPIESSKYFTYDQCWFAQELWLKLDCQEGKCIIPSLLIISTNRNDQRDINKRLNFKINIARFFLKLHLCRDKAMSLSEIRNIEEYISKYSPIEKCIRTYKSKKQLKENNVQIKDFIQDYIKKKEKRLKKKPKVVISFTVFFENSIDDESKDKIICNFLSDNKYSFNDTNLFAENKSICCTYHSNNSIIHIVFNKDNNGINIQNSKDCLIITEDILLKRLKNNRKGKSRIEDICGNTLLIVVFNSKEQTNEDIKKKKRYIKTKIEPESDLKRIIFVDQQRSTKIKILSQQSDKYNKSQFPISFDFTKEKTTNTLLSSFIHSYFNRIENYKTEEALIDKNTQYDLASITNIRLFSEEIRKKLRCENNHELPPYYLMPQKGRSRYNTLKSWFLSFDSNNIRNHKTYNQSALIVIFVIICYFYTTNRVIDEDKIKYLIKIVNKSLQFKIRQWSANNENKSMSTKKRIKIHDKNQFLDIKLEEVRKIVRDCSFPIDKL